MAAVPSIGRASRIEGPAAPEADATRELYERYGEQIFGYCLHQLGSREEAEDAVQSTFLNAFRGLRRGVEPEAEQAWLFKIAQNVCLSRHRSKWRRGRIESPADFELAEETTAAPARHADELIGLQDVLEHMPENRRRAILLREWQGLSYREIAEELELSQAAVETLIFRARRSLAQGLEASPAEQRSWRARLRPSLSLGSVASALKSLLAGSVAVKAAGTAAVVVVVTSVAVASPVTHTPSHGRYAQRAQHASPAAIAPATGTWTQGAAGGMAVTAPGAARTHAARRHGVSVPGTIVAGWHVSLPGLSSQAPTTGGSETPSPGSTGGQGGHVDAPAATPPAATPTPAPAAPTPAAPAPAPSAAGGDPRAQAPGGQARGGSSGDAASSDRSRASAQPQGQGQGQSQGQSQSRQDSSSQGQSSQGQSSSQGNGRPGRQDEPRRQTAAPAAWTLPPTGGVPAPRTQAPTTQPSATQASATQPPTTQPPATQPPAAQPPATQAGSGSGASGASPVATPPAPSPPAAADSGHDSGRGSWHDDGHRGRGH